MSNSGKRAISAQLDPRKRQRAGVSAVVLSLGHTQQANLRRQKELFPNERLTQGKWEARYQNAVDSWKDLARIDQSKLTNQIFEPLGCDAEEFALEADISAIAPEDRKTFTAADIGRNGHWPWTDRHRKMAMSFMAREGKKGMIACAGEPFIVEMMSRIGYPAEVWGQYDDCWLVYVECALQKLVKYTGQKCGRLNWFTEDGVWSPRAKQVIVSPAFSGSYVELTEDLIDQCVSKPIEVTEDELASKACEFLRKAVCKFASENIVSEERAVRAIAGSLLLHTYASQGDDLESQLIDLILSLVRSRNRCCADKIGSVESSKHSRPADRRPNRPTTHEDEAMRHDSGDRNGPSPDAVDDYSVSFDDLTGSTGSFGNIGSESFTDGNLDGDTVSLGASSADAYAARQGTDLLALSKTSRAISERPVVSDEERHSDSTKARSAHTTRRHNRRT